MPNLYSGIDVCRKIVTDIGGTLFVDAQSMGLGMFAAAVVF